MTPKNFTIKFIVCLDDIKKLFDIFTVFLMDIQFIDDKFSLICNVNTKYIIHYFQANRMLKNF